MNILFFLTPKSEVAHVFEDYTLRETLNTMERNKYTAVPILNREGKYRGTVTEGDLLRAITSKEGISLHDVANLPTHKIWRRHDMIPVRANSNIEDLVNVSMRQNFVPVVDDEDVFIGIITRKSIIDYCYKHSSIYIEKTLKLNEQHMNESGKSE